MSLCWIGKITKRSLFSMSKGSLDASTFFGSTSSRLICACFVVVLMVFLLRFSAAPAVGEWTVLLYEAHTPRSLTFLVLLRFPEVPVRRPRAYKDVRQVAFRQAVTPR